MACAEWLMKNGAQVRWKGCKGFVCHYNCLPQNMCKSHKYRKQFLIEQVIAGKEACISDVGFRYFSMYTIAYIDKRNFVLGLIYSVAHFKLFPRERGC